MNTKSILNTLTIVVISSSLSAFAMAREGGSRGEKIIDHLDLDGDGQISFDEFQPPRRMRFGKADANEDGIVTLEEIAEKRAARNEERESEKADRRAERHSKFTERFTAMDINGDGGLSQDEIKQGIFEKMDENQDGYITADEIKRPRGKGMRGKRGRHGPHSDFE